ncbi:MAG TPA: 4Fe-4S dicluster domain-containing protein [Elusimicrobiales bacterium]|nr:4Fe-4S dicluster domain-containing protein [Elusimicrobiales bacterium]
MPKIEVNDMRCKGCKLCVMVCPKNCIEMSDKFSVTGYFPAKMTKKDCCIGCGMCVQICPDLAITLYKEKAGIKTKKV